VYVSGLPPDAKNEDIYRIFSKAGIILKDPETGIPKIVVYRDDEGKCKGDAIVTFFRPESVALAIELLDDSFFDQKCKLKVEEVTYDQKDTKKKKTGGIKKSQKNKRYDQSKELSWKEVEKLHVILKHMFTPEESLVCGSYTTFCSMLTQNGRKTLSFFESWKMILPKRLSSVGS